MTNYPLFCTIEYKDRNVDIKIPVRVKKIAMQKFGCMRCKIQEGLTRIVNYYNSISHELDKKNFRLEWEYDETRRMNVPKNVVTNTHILCPQCLLSGIQTRMETDTVIKYKLYTTVSPNYVRVDELVDNILFPFRWRVRKRMQHNPPVVRVSMEAFSDKLDFFYQTMDDVKGKILEAYNKRRGTTLKIKMHKVTDDMLDKELQNYEKRKVINKI